jgi:hypothetical protein
MFEPIEEVPLDDYFFCENAALASKCCSLYWVAQHFSFFLLQLFSFVRKEKVLVDEHSFQKEFFNGMLRFIFVFPLKWCDFQSK